MPVFLVGPATTKELVLRPLSNRGTLIYSKGPSVLRFSWPLILSN